MKHNGKADVYAEYSQPHLPPNLRLIFMQEASWFRDVRVPGTPGLLAVQLWGDLDGRGAGKHGEEEAAGRESCRWQDVKNRSSLK